MFHVRKKQGRIVEAFCLGRDSGAALCRLIEEKKLIPREKGVWEVFSREAVNGKGELALDGDYIKLDSTGTPYPNGREFFEKNHRSLGGGRYEQQPVILEAWTADQGLCPEIRYLIENKGLVINAESEERYFTAPLWGTALSAAKDAVIVFYQIDRSEAGEILDASFNFVERGEFERTYERLM